MWMYCSSPFREKPLTILHPEEPVNAAANAIEEELELQFNAVQNIMHFIMILLLAWRYLNGRNHDPENAELYYFEEDQAGDDVIPISFPLFSKFLNKEIDWL